MRRALLVSGALLLPLAAGCGDDGDADPADAAPPPAEIPRLVYDGSSCLHEGPAQLAAGDVEIELVNTSDEWANVFVGRIGFGFTLQDAKDDLEPGPTPRSTRSWLGQSMPGQRPADAGETMRWESSLRPGEYVVNCTTRSGVWFGAGLTVVDE